MGKRPRSAYDFAKDRQLQKLFDGVLPKVTQASETAMDVAPAPVSTLVTVFCLFNNTFVQSKTPATGKRSESKKRKAQQDQPSQDDEQLVPSTVSLFEEEKT